MATVFLDSVEHYVTAGMTQKYDSVSGSAVVGNDGPNGRRAIRCGSAANSWARKIVPADATYAINFLWQPNALTGSAQILTLREGGTVHLDVRLITNVLRVTRNGTTLATGTTILTNLNYYWISFVCTIHDTTGSYTLYINGSSEVSGSGVDTRNGATGVIDNFLLGNVADRGSGNNRYCDIIVNSGTGGNTGIVSQRRVTYLPAAGVGNQADFTPSAGANWENVDETTADDATTTNTSSTSGHKDLLGLANLPSVATSVYAIQEVTRMRKDDAGARTARQVVRIGGTDYESADIAVTEAYVTYLNVREQNPNTSAAWGVNDPNNLEAGYKVQA